MNRNSTLTDDAGQLTTVEISRDKNTNKPVAAYIRVRDGKVVDTKELVGAEKGVFSNKNIFLKA